MRFGISVCLLQVTWALAAATTSSGPGSPPSQDVANHHVNQVDDLGSTATEASTQPAFITPVGPPAGFQPPSPCGSSSFKTPVYEFSNLHADATFRVNGSTNPPYYHTNFTVHDMANNYSLACDWGVSYWSSYQDDPYFRDACQYIGANGFRGDFTHQTHLQVQLFGVQDDSGRVLRLVQYWYCAQENGSYP